MGETKIALLGLGLMGSGMAGRLLDAGYPLTVWNRTPDKTQALADRGAKVAQSPRQAVAGATVVISMLADVPVCRDVWLGRGEAILGPLLEPFLWNRARSPWNGLRNSTARPENTAVSWWTHR